MKLTFVMLFPLSLSLYAQNPKYNQQPPPEQVRQSFHRDYPQASNPQWGGNQGHWHARFDDQGPDSRGEMIAHYDERGRNIDSHTYYLPQDVPDPVIRWAHNRYRHGSYEYTRIERPGQEDFFQVRVFYGGQYHIHYVDDYGHMHEYDDRH